MSDVITVSKLLAWAAQVEDILGTQWADKLRHKESQRIVRAQAYKTQELKTLHPIGAMLHQKDVWLRERKQNSKYLPNKNLFQLAALGKVLGKIRGLPNSQRILARIRQSDSFHSAVFEAEVIAEYLEREWAVEIVAEGIGRTPDLVVTNLEGQRVAVECKNRDIVSGRDKQNSVFWDQIENELMKTFGPDKLNFLVAIKCVDDPRPSERKRLVEWLTSLARQGGFGGVEERFSTWFDPTKRFEVAIQKLSEPDNTRLFNGVTFNPSEPFDRGSFECEMMKGHDGLFYYTNEKLFVFKCGTRPDKIVSITNAFKKAVGQIPSEGPGCVWVRVPDDGADQFGTQQMLDSVRSEMMGSSNRRVNAVALHTRSFHYNPGEGDQDESIVMKSVTLRVDHESPKFEAVVLPFPGAASGEHQPLGFK